MSKSPANQLTPDEAKNALYIDFEGRKDRLPILLGATRWQRASKVHQYVADPNFAPLGTADTLEVLDFAQSIERILQRAEKKDRAIVAWTTHEFRLVQRYAPQHLPRFEARYRNALAIAKHWRNASHAGAKPERGTLAAYLDLVGYTVPAGAGPGRAGETIGILGKALAAGKRADQLTPNQRQRWLDLREHNRHDCAGMRQIMLKATLELAIRPPKATRPRS